MKTVLYVSAVLIFGCSCTLQKKQTSATEKNYRDLSWKQVSTRMPDKWYGSREAKMVADSVLKYQTTIGGWPKNNNFHTGMNKEEWARIQASGIGATFDNGATLTEMKFLTKMYSQVKDPRYLNAFQKAFDYIIKAQYPNGGWPQFFPVRPGNGVAYNSHITYNDNAMGNIMEFLRDIAEPSSFYAAMPISPETKSQAKQAFDKGIDCILKTQISKNGRLTVWCAQHDEVTLLPAKARAYELASFSGSESVGLTLLLMELNNPSKDVINSVKGAVSWFESHKLEGIRLKDTVNTEGQKDRVVVSDKSAPPLWARFYDLDTEKPIFVDRDGIKRTTFAELGHNRRNGYSWYTNGPAEVLKRYPEWTKKWAN